MKLYVIRSKYVEGIEIWDTYYHPNWGWSTGIEDAKIYTRKPILLPKYVSDDGVEDVEVVELEV